MSYAEERLFYACTDFCEAFFKLLCEKDKIRRNWVSDDEKEVRLHFAYVYVPLCCYSYIKWSVH